MLEIGTLVWTRVRLFSIITCYEQSIDLVYGLVEIWVYNFDRTYMWNYVGWTILLVSCLKTLATSMIGNNFTKIALSFYYLNELLIFSSNLFTDVHISCMILESKSNSSKKMEEFLNTLHLKKVEFCYYWSS